MTMTTSTSERRAKPAEPGQPRSAAKASDPDAISRRAYELYEQRGREPGADVDDWLQAEHDLRESSPRDN
jgi:hypothetical protein